MYIVLLLLFCYLYTTAREIPEDFVYNECPPENESCEFWLNVEKKLTMRFRGALVYPYQGKLYKFDEFPENFTTQVLMEEVITVDGVERTVMTVNGTIPGPPIVVYENQTLIVHVTNSMLSESLSLHWHGLNQRGTPYMDGTGYITQCPIGFGQTFTHTFKATPSGTYWYHSHVGSQRTNGVFGALVIKKRKSDLKYPTDVIMTLGDWQHDDSDEVYLQMREGNYIGNEKYKITSAPDGSLFSSLPWMSGLIEGKGRYYNPLKSEENQAPVSWFKVKKGRTYRFRVIQTGNMYPLRVSIDGHMLLMISTDGCDVKPVVIESFIIHPGERFDFLFEANNTIGNYWIRAESIESDVQNHSMKAVLHYKGASEINEPSTERRKCEKNSKCNILNCPFNEYPKHFHINCIPISELQSSNENDVPPTFIANHSEEYFLNFLTGSVNGRKFKFPTVNALGQNKELGNEVCNDVNHNCSLDSVCYCFNQLSVPFNKTIQMIWLNKGVGAGWSHPIHLHGHSFYILKTAFAPQNKTTGNFYTDSNGAYIEQNDIICDNGSRHFCNNPRWRNASWKNGNIPGLNLKDPPRKDTLIIPSGGYAVIRIKSDNPGKWFMHCHIEVHALDGMALVLSEAEDKIPAPPEGFPTCRNFNLKQSIDNTLTETSEDFNKTTVNIQTFMLVTSVLGGIIFLLFVSLLTSLNIKWRCNEPTYYKIQ